MGASATGLEWVAGRRASGLLVDALRLSTLTKLTAAGPAVGWAGRASPPPWRVLLKFAGGVDCMPLSSLNHALLTWHRLGVFLFGIVLLLLTGCASHPGSWSNPAVAPEAVAGGQAATAPPPDAKLMPAIIGPPPDPSVEDLIYRIGPYDDLRVEVFGVPELSADGQVNLQGLIALPLIGPVLVQGMTPDQAGIEIARRLASRYIRDPRVTVYVKNSASLNVTISGFAGQGVVPIKGRMTLSDILAKSGGVSDLAKTQQVVLYRAKGGRSGASGRDDVQAYVIDYQAILDGRLRDPLMVGNDHVYVPPSGYALFFGPIARIFQTWVRPSVPGF